MPDTPAGRAGNAAVLDKLSASLGSSLLEAVSAQDMDEAAIPAASLLPAIAILREGGYDHLLDIGVTDHLPLTPRFEISYHLLAFGRMTIRRSTAPSAAALVPARFRLRVFADDLNPVVPSLTGLWPNADWPEREAWDLFGIRFDGHPDLRRILMPDDWEGHPLRKDYPLRGLNRRFSPGGKAGDVPPVVTK